MPRTTSAVLILAVCWLVPAGAQDNAAALKASLAKNQAALKQYSWVETTQISLKGEVKKTEQKQCSYGADGKVQKTVIPGAAPKAAPPPSSGGRGGRLKKKVVENKVEDLKEYMEQVAALVHQYVPPDPQKLQAATVEGTTLTAKNYVKPGDSLAIGFDATALAMRTYKVTSYVEKPDDDAVALSVTFATLPDAVTYPQKIVLDATGKKVQVTVTNSGYKKAGT